jgi:predicted SAM-dependent methyltransferase
MTKLELGSGQRPTPGYLHSDVQPFDDIDFICSPEKIGLPDRSLDEILALGVMEHLRFAQVGATLQNCHRMLRSEGVLIFDVPDLLAWCEMYSMLERGEQIPFTREHVLSTLYGWQRWDGDEHKSGWSKETIDAALRRAGFKFIEHGVELMFERGHDRRRFHRPEDAHVYTVAHKT